MFVSVLLVWGVVCECVLCFFSEREISVAELQIFVFKLQLTRSCISAGLLVLISLFMYLFTLQQTISQATAAKYPRTLLHSSGSATMRPAGQTGRILQGQTPTSVQSIKVVD